MYALIHKFQEPFPDRANHGKNLLSLFGVGVFVTLFLYLIEPFGLGQMKNGLFAVCAGFGGVTVVFGWLYDSVFRFVLRVRTDLPSWTLWKWILQSIGLLIWIAVGNYLYLNYLLGFNELKAAFLLQMIANSALVGIFPVVFSGLMIQLKAAKTNEHSANELQPQLQAHASQPDAVVRVIPVNNAELNLHTKSIRYVEAMQNYVQVHYVDAGALQKELVRSTIASMETLLADSSIVRCHRSYLINIDAIEQVSGNAQGLKLRVADVSAVEIPVSRSYIPHVKQLLGRA